MNDADARLVDDLVRAYGAFRSPELVVLGLGTVCDLLLRLAPPRGVSPADLAMMVELVAKGARERIEVLEGAR